MQWWTGALLFLFMFIVVAFAFVSRKPLCIDSRIVEKIDRTSTDGVAEAYRCALYRHVPFDPNLAEWTHDLGHRLQKLERDLEWLGGLHQKVTISIRSDMPSYFSIVDHHIYLSESVLRAKGQLEKALLKIWFRERARGIFPRSLEEESLTDILYFSLRGDLNIEDPKTGLELGQDINARWPRVLTSIKGYCHGLWTDVEHLSLCERLVDEDEVRADIYMPSLRPLITQSLIGALSKLSAQERHDWLVEWTTGLEQFRPTSPGQLQDKVMNFQDAEKELKDWIGLTKSLAQKSEATKKISWYFEEELKNRGFANSEKSDLDAIIFSEQVTPELDKRAAPSHFLLLKGRIQSKWMRIWRRSRKPFYKRLQPHKEFT